MMKLVLAGTAALMLGLGSAYAAPIRSPALGDAMGSQTTQAMMEHRTMHRGYMHRGYGMHHRGMMMRHHMMRHRMHHRMMRRM
jgi:hypothetical protein